MGIGGQYSAVQYPRWLLATVGLTCVLLGAGVSVGIRYAFGVSRVDKIELAHYRLEARVDTLQTRVDSIVIGAVEPNRLLRSLATLKCLDGTSPALLDAAGLQCARLLGVRR